MTRTMMTTFAGEGVLFVQGPGSNWVVLSDEAEVALIDTGYPADRGLVEQSIMEAGARGLPLTTIFVTHGHSDHIGNAAALAARDGGTVLAAAAEIPNVRREIVEQVGFGDILPRLWNPRVALWTWHALRAGGLQDVGVPEVRPLPAGPVRVAGFTVTPVPTPGHSSGHTAFLLPEANALVTGDALVTAHPTSRRRGPQLLPEMFHANANAAVRALEAVAHVRASVILPGHGPLLYAHPSEAVERLQAARTQPFARPEPAFDRYLPPFAI